MQFEGVLSKTLFDSKVNIGHILSVCQQAGEAILSVYHSDDFGVQFKDDGSPVTRADLAADQVIAATLSQLTPEWPVFSEEASDVPFSERATWETYWLVDPLDGTRGFVNRCDDFTVNIALIHMHKPVFGVVYVPVEDVFYFGGSDVKGAWRQSGDNSPEPISTRSCAPDGVLIAAVSRHISEGKMANIFLNLNERFADVHTVEWSGAVKGCLVADGSVDIYPRQGATCEWDTAAFQAVVECAGGKVFDIYGQALEYNRKSSLINPDFYVVGDPTVEWAPLLMLIPPVKL